MIINEDDDFGFSLLTEQELEENNQFIKEKIEQSNQKAVLTEEQWRAKLVELKDMVMPLLKNLAKDPDKEYILWPNRVEKIQKFMNKIEKYVDEA
jgi:hypothetical protein